VPDARTGKRFPVNLPIRIHLCDTANDHAGTTANVSAAGVYIRAEAHKAKTGVTEQHLRPGAMVEFFMTLPAEAIGGETDVQIHCRGRVVRVEQLPDDDSRSGVACVIDKYEFLRKA
jgi:hypothetical protein